MDAKFGFDDNADFRQKDVFKLRDVTQEDPQEVEAAEVGYTMYRTDNSTASTLSSLTVTLAASSTVPVSPWPPWTC